MAHHLYVAVLMFVLVTWYAPPANGQQAPTPRSSCFGNQAIAVPPTSNCTKDWLRCDGGRYYTCYCPNENNFFNPATGKCDHFERIPGCLGQLRGRLPVRPRGRKKRQALTGCQPDCPANMLFYMYPDWNDCAKFITCTEGVLETRNCRTEVNFQYYNPELFSCEVDLSLGETPIADNVCVNRLTRRK